jgi:hypothetical protein
MRTLLSLLCSIVSILACGALGAAAGMGVRAWLALDGIAGALVALFSAMVVATAAWGLGMAVLRAARVLR